MPNAGRATATIRDRLPSGRFFALDAFRGVAAVIVVCLHNHGHFHGLPLPASGWLAVDLFFLLSGFVIAHAYDQRLAGAMTPRRFLQVRLIRLYPLYFLGLAIGAIDTLLIARPWSGAVPLRPFVEDIGLGFLLLPSPHTIGQSFDPTFPLNLPAWSLFFELVVNLVYAAVHRHLTTRRLVVLVIAAGVALVGTALAHGSSELGNYWHTFAAGIPRVAFSFFMGVLLHRLPLRWPALGAGWFAGLTLLLIGLLMLRPGPGAVGLGYDLLCILGIFPLLVLAGAAVRSGPSLQSLCAAAGDTSYAIYILHFTVTAAVLHRWSRLGPAIHESAVTGPAFIGLLLVGCYAVDRFYDAPVRRFLSSRLSPSPKT